MTDGADGSLQALVAATQERIKALRSAGDLPALLAAAQAAAGEIERRVGERRDDAARQALLTVKRFTYNTAADCWPGWSVSDVPLDGRHLEAAQELARHSARLVTSLGLGALQEGTGTWLCGAFDLALGRYAEASSAFDAARGRYLAAGAPGLVLLTEGYIAIVRQVAGEPSSGAEDLQDISARITAGGFEDGAEWIEQLRTAQKAFSRRC